ncbi:MAG TPA: Hsp20/alpha crystallin family protein [Chloroflexota bacterium]|nr:Hsp20/alpha crystallin family protein [Chloroflexota bacterium]
MANLAIRDPFTNMLPLSEAMNNLFERSFLSPRSAGWWQQPYQPMDVYETPDEYVIRAMLPGFRPEDVNISAVGNQLTISGKPAAYSAPEGARYLIQEITTTEFQRSLTLPAEFDVNKAQASYESGVLTLTLPKAEVAKPKQITISAK